MIDEGKPIINFLFSFLDFSSPLPRYAITNEDNNDVDARMICERERER